MIMSRKRELLPFLMLCGFLTFALLTGGASRPDAQSHIFLRPVAVLFGAAALALMWPEQLRKVRAPLLFLAALAAIMLIQIVPFPPSVWTSLPGRELVAQIAPTVGMEQPWRPISLSPARTLNSLVALLPPIAALLLFAAVTTERSYGALTLLCGLLALSAVMGLAQIIGPPEGPLYLYRVTNNGSAVGFFANRNHQAVLLACLFPMLAVLASLRSENEGFDRFRFWASVGMGVLLIPLLIVTGSRSGVALAIVGMAAAWLLFERRLPERRGPRRRGRGRLIAWIAVAAAVAAVIAATIFLSRAEAFDRLFDQTLTDDLRFRLFDLLVGLASSNFPFGTGFGTFDLMFKVIEPHDMLQYAYVNHAHNDLLQLAIEGGLPGLLLLGAFLLWWGRRSLAAWRPAREASRRIRFARLGSVVTLILMLASIVDYPLRTPFVMVVFALACAWLGMPDKEAYKAEEPAPGRRKAG